MASERSGPRNEVSRWAEQNVAVNKLAQLKAQMEEEEAAKLAGIRRQLQERIDKQKEMLATQMAEQHQPRGSSSGSPPLLYKRLEKEWALRERMEEEAKQRAYNRGLGQFKKVRPNQIISGEVRISPAPSAGGAASNGGSVLSPPEPQVLPSVSPSRRVGPNYTPSARLYPPPFSCPPDYVTYSRAIEAQQPGSGSNGEATDDDVLKLPRLGKSSSPARQSTSPGRHLSPRAARNSLSPGRPQHQLRDSLAGNGSNNGGGAPSDRPAMSAPLGPVAALQAALRTKAEHEERERMRLARKEMLTSAVLERRVQEEAAAAEAEAHARAQRLRSSRGMAHHLPTQKGAFVAGKPADVQCRILYPQCKSMVYTPSDWDGQLAARSSRKPAADLQLEYVYGYNGHAAAQNLFVNARGQLVWFVAGVAVVYDKPSHSQRFFRAHNDDISALAVCPAPVDLSGGGAPLPPRSVFATGQVSDPANGPYICVWDSLGQPQPAELLRIPMGKDARGVTALGFSPDGTYLAAVTTDNDHTVTVYDWRSRVKLGSGLGYKGDPPAVHGIEWNPHSATHPGIPAEFVTFGRKHVKSWKAGADGAWVSTMWSFGKLDMQTLHSAAWLLPSGPAGDSCTVVAGAADGQIYLFRGGVAIKAVKAHGAGPQVVSAGAPAYSGLRGMRLIREGGVLLTAGADGVLLPWDVADGALVEGRVCGKAIPVKSPYYGPNEKPPQIRALDYDEHTDAIYVGTASADIIEVSTTSQVMLLYGHSSDVHCVAFHPALPHLCITVADSGRLFVWDTEARQMARTTRVQGGSPRVAAWSPKPYDGSHHLAVGGDKGVIDVLNEADFRPLTALRDSKQGVTDLEYSPDGRFLAAGTRDTWIDVYSVEQGYSRVARCSGHSASVTSLDWSVDSTAFRSTSADNEILYWSPETGKQVTGNQRDVRWASYNAVVGFEVMGIWPAATDNNDVNSLDRSHDERFVVTADDFGLVKLFNYPCVVQKAPFREYPGHSSHIMGVRWSPDDRRVVSVGGMDQAVFQFAVTVSEEPEIGENGVGPHGGPLHRAAESFVVSRAGPPDTEAARQMLVDDVARSRAAPSARTLGQQAPTHKGAFPPGKPAKFAGKILYPQCKTPVYTPTTWDPMQAVRSSRLPAATLALEFVHGYNGNSANSKNLFANVDGQLVWFVAGVAVVYDKAAHSQRFFFGHNDDVSAMALCSPEVEVGGAQYPARSLVATGQVSDPTNGPYICVWDSSQHSLPEVARLPFGKDGRSIVALGFAPDGALLTAVTSDNDHTVYIIDWRGRTRLGQGNGYRGDPPAVYGVEWNPHQLTSPGVPAEFVTFGRKHIKSWRVNAEGAWASNLWGFGKLDMQNIHSAAWLKPAAGQTECMVAAGASDGQVYLFKGGAAVKAVAAHQAGPQSLLAGALCFSGVRGMQLIKNDAVLLTGGADGVVLSWDVADGALVSGRFAAPARQVGGAASSKPPQLRCVEYDEVDDALHVGTSGCDVVEIAPMSGSGGQQRPLVYGHSSDIWGVAFHPAEPHVCATVASDVSLWDVAERKLLRVVELDFAARCVTFSTQKYNASPAHHIAVGGEKGHVEVLLESDLSPVFRTRDSKQGVTDLEYSPDGRFLAAGTRDTWIDVYSVEQGYSRVHRLTGHTATVVALDWSADSRLLKSTSADHEFLCWAAEAGRQVLANQRDTPWASYNSTLGFEVMGIWPAATDNNDVNSLDRSHDARFVVTADDFGLVKLFNYPCVVQKAPFREYPGHSSHIMGVRFSCDDSRVVSVGGMDRAVFQFAVTVGEEPELPQSADALEAAVFLDDGPKTFKVAAPKQLPGGAATRKSAAAAASITPASARPGLSERTPAAAPREAVPLQKGAFLLGKSTKFSGKIMYPQCRSPVYTPTGWETSLVLHSSRPPPVKLELAFVHGYNGHMTPGNNLNLNARGQLVWFVAGVAVVYDKAAHSQRFFFGHNDDVSAMALCGASVEVAGKQYAPRSLVVTGQVSDAKMGPYICVWDSTEESPTEVCRLSFGKDARGVTALGFSPDGGLLAAVTTDNNHTVYVFDWRQRQNLGGGSGIKGDPPAVYGVEWNPHSATHPGIPAEFVTFGRKHIKSWRVNADGAWAGSTWGFGKFDVQSVCAASWLKPAAGQTECWLAAGMSDGQVYLFKGGAAVKAVKAHSAGPAQVRPFTAGAAAYSGVRGMKLTKGGSVLMTGGADGQVLFYEAGDGMIKDGRFAAKPLQLKPPHAAAAGSGASVPRPAGSAASTGRMAGEDQPPQIASLEYSESDKKVVVGTTSGEVLVAGGAASSGQQDTLVAGHSSDVWGAATHPAQPHIAATVADSSRIFVWDLNSRKVVRTTAVGFACRCVAFSTQPVGGGKGGTYHLAVGGEKGYINILDAGDLKPVHGCKDSAQGVACLKYSPDGRFLAAATFDQWIDVYSVEQGYSRVARCSGHSATVKFLDWSADYSSVLKSVSADNEVLYWHAESGKQVTANQRDTPWSSYNCPLGFEVMGIWPPNSDGTDINALDRSHDARFIATADDFGLVKLFNFPCLVQNAPATVSIGHSSHVMAVRFSSDDSRVISAGGSDRAVFQYVVAAASGADDADSRLGGGKSPLGGGGTGTHYTPEAPAAASSVGASDSGVDAVRGGRRQPVRAIAKAAAAPPPVMPSRLLVLEDELQEGVRKARTPSEDVPATLARVCAGIDDGSGLVRKPALLALAAALQVRLSGPEVDALLKKHGDPEALAYDKLLGLLKKDSARALATAMPTRKGAFPPGKPAKFAGKILYPQCRKAVYTPSDWDPVLALRSSRPPRAELRLEFVHGYAGAAVGNNVAINARGHLVWFVAGLSIVYDVKAHSQRFFFGHNDDVSAMALCGASVEVGGAQYPARSLVATGQVSDAANGPYICVWDSLGKPQPAELARLPFGKDVRGVVALGFSPDGALLTAVTSDNDHTVYIYNWRQRQQVGSGSGIKGDPPAVYGVEWNPHSTTHPGIPAEFVTFGRKHIKSWRVNADGAWAGSSWGCSKLELQNIHSAAWLKPAAGQTDCCLAAGMSDGQVYLFKGGAAVKAIQAHEPGPQALFAGAITYSGVRGMRLINNDGTLLTGGADGVVLSWDVADGGLVEGRCKRTQVMSTDAAGSRPPQLRGLDYDAATSCIYVGTAACDIVQVPASGQQQLLLCGHETDVYGAECHPTRPDLCVTVADSVSLWDLAARKLLKDVALGFAARCVTISPRPYKETKCHHVAVGGADGQLAILRDGDLTPIHSCCDSKQGVTDLEYSPDGRFLAAGTRDTWIDVYSVEQGYRRVARCSGHSASVTNLDWSADSSLFRSTSDDHDVLYWSAESGKQVTANQRDTPWASYNSTLGFEVMGIWPAATDNNDVNSLDRSHDHRFIATADDFGLVKLFNYPCVVQNAPHRRCEGHSSHVMGVRFSLDDSRVISVGGLDKALFQYAVVDAPEPEVETGSDRPQLSFTPAGGSFPPSAAASGAPSRVASSLPLVAAAAGARGRPAANGASPSAASSGPPSAAPSVKGQAAGGGGLFDAQLRTLGPRALRSGAPESAKLPLRKGAFIAGKPPGSEAQSLQIMYPQCRTPVYTPTGWDAAAVVGRSSKPPDKTLRLEFVHGYNGNSATGPNLFSNANGHLVWFVAGLSIVYDVKAHSQRFFFGHNDDVSAMALCGASVEVGGAQYPARSLVATGQVSDAANGPYICVWDSSQDGLPEVARLPFKKDARSIAALGFSPDGAFLAAVTTDQEHSVYVYDWRAGRRLGGGLGFKGEPPMVYGLEWNPHSVTHEGIPLEFVTFGKKHIRSWRQSAAADGADNGWASNLWGFGKLEVQHIHSAAWLLPAAGQKECMLAAGTADGHVYMFKGGAAVRAVAAHAPGPQALVNAAVSYSGLRGMRLITNGGTLLTGGADGVVLSWDVSGGSIEQPGAPLARLSRVKPTDYSDVKPPALRALDYDPASGAITVGTATCDVVRLATAAAAGSGGKQAAAAAQQQQTTLVCGHHTDVWGVDFHPVNPQLVFTVADDVSVWNVSSRRLLKDVALGFPARCVAISPQPYRESGDQHHVAVGGADGQLMVLDASALTPIHSCRDSKQGVTDLEYSPDGRFLAAGTRDTWIDVYSVEQGYRRVARCSGHSATIYNIDWSSDGQVLRSTAADGEFLLWHAETGRQITAPLRDLSWASYNSTLGFEVMGIWPPDSDGNDVNSLDRSHDARFVVTADDFGYVKLFNYPCVVQKAPHASYPGHSSHIMGVRFNCDDSRVVSVGGMDRAVFQYVLADPPPPPPPPPPPKPMKWGPLDPEGKQWGYMPQ